MPFAKQFFNTEEQALILQSIANAEKQTSGEIRLHLENFCLGNEITAAKKVFNRLGMHKTNERNGILIYIATMSRKIAIIGDKGIHEKLGEAFWDALVKQLIAEFKQNNKANSLAKAIEDCGTMLGKYFPYQSGDVNELSNDISY
jgi:uncharacterized membrane protein